jgi:hypothetical protein
MAATPVRVSVEQARLVAIAAQELGRAASARTGELLARTGFVRTLGGVEACLALFARAAGLRAADVHAAVERREAQVVPAVRGCMYLVAARHVPLCLRVAERLSSSRDQREHEKAGIRPGELAELGRAIVSLLCARGRLTTDALRKELPEGSVRGLGAAGKKIGLSSTLPPALRRLEFDRLIERAVDGGRLDSERYHWRVVDRSRPDSDPVPDDWNRTLAAVAAIYFRAAGIGSLAELSAWSGAPRRDVAAAVADLPLVPVAIEGRPGAFAMWEGNRALLDRADQARDVVAFLPFEDNLAAYQGGPGPLVDPALHGMAVPGFEADKPVVLGESRHVLGRSLVAEGRLAGLWDYDPDRQSVEYALFQPVARATRAHIDDRAHDVSRFLADEVGHGRSNSLDTDDELRRRVTALRAFARQGPAPAKRPAAKAAPKRAAGKAAPVRAAAKKAAPKPGKTAATSVARRPRR